MKPGDKSRLRVWRTLLCLFFLAISGFAFPLRANSNRRIRLLPQFSAGQSFQYRIQLRIGSSGKVTGPITDPEGPKKLAQTVNVILQIDILSVSPAPSGVRSAIIANSEPRGARIRATYQKASVTSQSDSYNPSAAEAEKQFQKLAGKSIEFTLEPSGEITHVTGLAEILPDSARAATVQQWLSQLTLGASLPKKGIKVGEKWTTRQSINNAPLSGLAWRSESTYLRNEPCSASHLEPSPVASSQSARPHASGECAIILTRSEIIGSRAGKDRTPPDYRHNGLRTSGIWTGQSESLTSISLRTGMVAGVTQTGSTHADFTVLSVTSGNHIHYLNDTRSQSQITLVSPSGKP